MGLDFMFVFCSIQVNVSGSVQIGGGAMSDIQQAGSEGAAAVALDGSMAAAEPRGIGGWLLLVALGQVVGPLQLIVSLGHYLEPESAELFDLYPLAMVGEVAINLVLLLLALTTAVLFFARSRYFPRLFIVELVVIPVFAILGTLWIAFAFSYQLDAPFSEFLIVERQDLVQLGLAVVAALIWIPYTLKSRRVKNTFDPLRAPPRSAGAHRQQESVALLRAVVGIVAALGLIGLVVGLERLIGRGAFSGQLVGGALQIALAVWLFRGSSAARVILAFLYGLGLALGLAVALVHPFDGLMPVAIWLAVAIVCAAVLWVLCFSKRFRAELAVRAAMTRWSAQPLTRADRISPPSLSTGPGCSTGRLPR